MTEAQGIVAYRYKGEWYPAEEIQTKRDQARKRNDTSLEAYFPDANPYSIATLRRRREYGRDVPEWIDLGEPPTVDEG